MSDQTRSEMSESKVELIQLFSVTVVTCEKVEM